MGRGKCHGKLCRSRELLDEDFFFAGMSPVSKILGRRDLGYSPVKPDIEKFLLFVFLLGFLLNKAPGTHQPKRVENARILIANTPMDTDKIKVFGSRVRVENVAKVAEIELAEKEKMKDKVSVMSSQRFPCHQVMLLQRPNILTCFSGRHDLQARHQRVREPSTDLQLP